MEYLKLYSVLMLFSTVVSGVINNLNNDIIDEIQALEKELTVKHESKTNLKELAVKYDSKSDLKEDAADLMLKELTDDLMVKTKDNKDDFSMRLRKIISGNKKNAKTDNVLNKNEAKKDDQGNSKEKKDATLSEQNLQAKDNDQVAKGKNSFEVDEKNKEGNLEDALNNDKKGKHVIKIDDLSFLDLTESEMQDTSQDKILLYDILKDASIDDKVKIEWLFTAPISHHELMADTTNDEEESKRDNPGCLADKRPDCQALKKRGFCETHKIRMMQNHYCDRTCIFGKCACRDTLTQYRCEYLKNFRGKYLCETETRMRQTCAKTCHHCAVPSPPKCSETKYACCWDKITIRKDKKGSNCPKCEDNYRYVCDTFKDDCPKISIAGDFMRFHCPKKCGLCDSNRCTDQARYAGVCPLWKDTLGWCTDKRMHLSMNYFCPKTCGFC